jgi:hypothetical protein
VVNKNGTVTFADEPSEEEIEVEVTEYYDQEVDEKSQIAGGDKSGKAKMVKKKKKKVIVKKKSKELNYEQVSHNATSEDELGQQKGIKFEKVKVDSQM